MRSIRSPARQDGFTLVEMMGSLLLVIAIGSMIYAAPKPSPQRDAGEAVRRMRAMLVAALADAELEGGEVVVRAEAAPSGERSGRFIALAGPAGVTLSDDPAADWVELTRGVVWRAGTATTDPLGAATDGRVPGTVRCSAESCETGTAEYVTWFVGHARGARVAWALVLTRERDVQLFRWEHASSTWKTET